MSGPNKDNRLSTDGTFENSLRVRSRQRRSSLTRAAAQAEFSPRNDILPKLELIQVDIKDLSIPPRNVRKVEDLHVKEVAASIATFGLCAPPIIDQENRVIDGVIVIEAARRVGLKRIACIRVGHLNSNELRLLRLALNRLGEKGSWAFQELKLELNELALESAPIEITGFSRIEIDQINLDVEPDAHEAGPLEPEPDAKPVSQVGDVFALGDHVLACGDSTDPAVLRLMMADDEARIILTDQPYNCRIAGNVTTKPRREFVMASGEMSAADFRVFNKSYLNAALPYLCEGGLFGTFIDWRGYVSIVTVAEELGLTPINVIVWAKGNGGMGSLYRSAYELLPLFKKGKAPHVNNVELGKHGRWRSNVWHYPGASCMGSEARSGLQLHPTVKPTSMLEDALLDLSQRGEIVLDPFMGSGSTLMAAEKSCRRCRGIELDPLYVDVIIRRYQTTTGHAARLRSTGETFDQLSLSRPRVD
jgi:DNA modification methylase